MSKKKTFIENQRNLTPFDLRTELLLDSLLQNKIDDFNIVIKPNGLFYRKFSKDKMSINRDSIDTDILNIEISRDGFYDILPESISHNYRNSDSFSNPVEEFKTRKKEEKEARNFFNPIENELFRFKYAIEKNESSFFSNLNANGIVDIIKTILVFEENIPDKLVVKMFYALLQLKDNSNQNIDEIVSILEQIINEKVTYKTSYIKLENVNDNVDESNDLIMGINTTLESSERIFLKKYNFIIGPLKKSEELSKYFQNQLMESFLNNFFNLFLPFHVQYSFEVTLNKKDQAFSMDEKQYKSRLGISTIL
ncbi:hypothetical protein [Flavobacterium sp. HNIBRBA15423]|uniref:hypothetical protein n=1 Tax=Flavobacterium sp. HNIBRBA15423 TaxID=3458683 RepID=UPI0040448FE8